MKQAVENCDFNSQQRETACLKDVSVTSWQLQVGCLPYPAYSPHLTPSNFHLCPSQHRDLGVKVAALKKVLWGGNLGCPMSSDYLTHCSRLFFTSICIMFSASYSLLSQGLMTPTSLARSFIDPKFCRCPFEALMPITAILIPTVDCMLLLHQLVIGPITVHLMCNGS